VKQQNITLIPKKEIQMQPFDPYLSRWLIVVVIVRQILKINVTIDGLKIQKEDKDCSVQRAIAIVSISID
jgi:hypothetical protein